MRVAITGASGNVGTALLRALKTSRHDYSLVGLSRRAPESVEPYAGVEWHAVDVADHNSARELRQAFSNVDAVVHLAVVFQPMRERGYLRRVNVDGLQRVASACAEAGVRHLVQMSSSGVYSAGAYGTKVDETWPRTGVPSSTYSMDKAAAELLLDEFERAHPDITVARVRPGLIGQYEFGSSILRYALPDLVPSAVVKYAPLLPIDRSFVVPAVHSDDVADVIERILRLRVGGAFNIAAPTPVRADDVADAMGARIIPTPYGVLSAGVRTGFSAHVLPIHHGWVDLAFNTPLLDTGKAERELKWRSTVDGPDVIREVVRGIREGGSAASPSLRGRSLLDRVRSFSRRGFVSRGWPS